MGNEEQNRDQKPSWEREPPRRSHHWYFEPKITLVAIIALAAQLVIGIYYFGVLSERINNNSTSITKFQEEYGSIPTQLAVLEALMKSIDLRLQQLSSGVEKHEVRFHEIGDRHE